jgi:hypothetical protein
VTRPLAEALEQAEAAFNGDSDFQARHLLGALIDSVQVHLAADDLAVKRIYETRVAELVAEFPTEATQALIEAGTLVRTDEGGYQIDPPLDPSDPEYELVLPAEETDHG